MKSRFLCVLVFFIAHQYLVSEQVHVHFTKRNLIVSFQFRFQTTAEDKCLELFLNVRSETSLDAQISLWGSQVLVEEVNGLLVGQMDKFTQELEKSLETLVNELVVADPVKQTEWKAIAREMIHELIARERLTYLELVRHFRTKVANIFNPRIEYEEGMQAVMAVCKQSIFLAKMILETIEGKLHGETVTTLKNFDSKHFTVLRTNAERNLTEAELRTINAHTDELMARQSLYYFDREIDVRRKANWPGLLEAAMAEINAVDKMAAQAEADRSRFSLKEAVAINVNPNLGKFQEKVKSARRVYGDASFRLEQNPNIKLDKVDDDMWCIFPETGEGKAPPTEEEIMKEKEKAAAAGGQRSAAPTPTTDESVQIDDVTAVESNEVERQRADIEAAHAAKTAAQNGRNSV